MSVSPATTLALPVRVYVPRVFGALHAIPTVWAAPEAREIGCEAPTVPPDAERETVKVAV